MRTHTHTQNKNKKYSNTVFRFSFRFEFLDSSDVSFRFFTTLPTLLDLLKRRPKKRQWQNCTKMPYCVPYHFTSLLKWLKVFSHMWCDVFVNKSHIWTNIVSSIKNTKQQQKMNKQKTTKQTKNKTKQKNRFKLFLYFGGFPKGF